MENKPNTAALTDLFDSELKLKCFIFK